MKYRKTLIIVSVTTVALVVLHWFGSSRVQPLYTISTELVLPTSPEQSWSVLTDFEQYPKWNPYLTRVEGKLRAGERVSFTLVDENFPEPLDLTAQLGEVLPDLRFYWVGRIGVQGLFDTRHVFELLPREDGGTDLHHYEEFRGIIPALLPNTRQRKAKTRRAFESMNQALLERLQTLY